MAQQTINIGTTANDGTGDPLRSAFDKVNDNFTELYSDDAGDVNSVNGATGAVVLDSDDISEGSSNLYNQTHTGDVTGSTALTIANDAVNGDKIADDSIDSEHYVDGSIDAAHIASSAVTNAKINNGAVNMDKLSATIIVTESEGIGSNDNDTTLPTSAAVKDYVDTEVGAITDNDTLGALTATDGGFVVGDGSNFGVETGSTARDSIGLGTSGHIQFHCLGIGQSPSTNNGQIDATTVYADTFGKDSGDYLAWTTDTQLDFYVNGSNEMRLEDDGDLHVDGDVVAASTTVSSDERLKDNIATYKNAIDTLKELKGVSFEWKKDGKKSGGVIAQDVEKVLPELVGTKKSLKGEKETLTVDYNGLVGVLIQAVKELSHKVEKLEKR